MTSRRVSSWARLASGLLRALVRGLVLAQAQVHTLVLVLTLAQV
jgi:IS5 family transposase